MKVTRYKAGDYIVTIHNRSFDLTHGGGKWWLCNFGLRVCTSASTNAAVLAVVSKWTPEDTERFWQLNNPRKEYTP